MLYIKNRYISLEKMIYLILPMLSFMYLAYYNYSYVLTTIQLARMVYKLIQSIPPDDGKSIYSPFSDEYGAIPYRFNNEDRIFLFPRNTQLEIDGASSSLFARVSGKVVNITPPPGVRMNFLPHEINASHVKILSGEDIFEYEENDLVVYPRVNEVYD